MTRSATKQSRTRVNSRASKSDSPEKLSTNIVNGQSEQDLGGPTETDYKSTNDSAKLHSGKGSKKVSNRVNSRARHSESGGKLGTSVIWAEDSEYDEDEYLDSEEEYDEDEDELELTDDDDDYFEDDDELEESRLSDSKTVWHGKGSSHSESGGELTPGKTIWGTKNGKKIAVDASGKVRKESYELDDDYINFLTEGEELSEEFKAKAQQIFENAVTLKVNQEIEEFENLYENAINEELESYKEELAEKLDEFLQYVCSEWLNENKLAIESGIKLEIAENFMSGIKSVFEENYIEVPEEKVDILEGMTATLDEMEQKLNEQIEKNIELNNELGSLLKESVFNDVTYGLADSQREKFAVLAESIDFTSEDDYRERLLGIKETYFKPKKVSYISEDLDTTVDVPTYYTSDPNMAAYVKAVSRSRSK